MHDYFRCHQQQGHDRDRQMKPSPPALRFGKRTYSPGGCRISAQPLFVPKQQQGKAATQRLSAAASFEEGVCCEISLPKKFRSSELTAALSTGNAAVNPLQHDPATRK
jgi:hypothetical protein